MLHKPPCGLGRNSSLAPIGGCSGPTMAKHWPQGATKGPKWTENGHVLCFVAGVLGGWAKKRGGGGYKALPEPSCALCTKKKGARCDNLAKQVVPGWVGLAPRYAGK